MNGHPEPSIPASEVAAGYVAAGMALGIIQKDFPNVSNKTILGYGHANNRPRRRRLILAISISLNIFAVAIYVAWAFAEVVYHPDWRKCCGMHLVESPFATGPYIFLPVPIAGAILCCIGIRGSSRTPAALAAIASSLAAWASMFICGFIVFINGLSRFPAVN